MFELDRIRRRKLPPASIVVGALTIAVFVLEAVLARSPDADVQTLYALGASERRAIWERHELWRLLCPAFLHAGLIHIAMNGYSFVQLAPFIERVWGWSRFLVVYVVSAIAGAALSSHMSAAVSVGASGAIFGLMGFLIVAAYSGAQRHEVRSLVKGMWGQGLLISVGAVLFYGSAPGTHIDNYAHVGGLLAGAVLGLLLVETDEDDRSMRAMGAGAALAIAGALGASALDYRRVARFEDEWRGLLAATAREDHDAVAAACDRALALDAHDPRVPLLFYFQGKAYLRSGRLEEAYYTLDRAWRNAEAAEVAALLVEVSVRRKDTKLARSWAETLKTIVGQRGAATLLLDPETKAAIAAIASE